MTDMTCQFSAYLMYSEIFSLFWLKSCFNLKWLPLVYQSYVPIHYRGVHKYEGYLPLGWKRLHHHLQMFVQSL